MPTQPQNKKKRNKTDHNSFPFPPLYSGPFYKYLLQPTKQKNGNLL